MSAPAGLVSGIATPAPVMRSNLALDLRRRLQRKQEGSEGMASVSWPSSSPSAAPTYSSEEETPQLSGEPMLDVAGAEPAAGITSSSPSIQVSAQRILRSPASPLEYPTLAERTAPPLELPRLTRALPAVSQASASSTSATSPVQRSHEGAGPLPTPFAPAETPSETEAPDPAPSVAPIAGLARKTGRVFEVSPSLAPDSSDGDAGGESQTPPNEMPLRRQRKRIGEPLTERPLLQEVARTPSGEPVLQRSETAAETSESSETIVAPVLGSRPRLIQKKDEGEEVADHEPLEHVQRRSMAASHADLSQIDDSFGTDAPQVIGALPAPPAQPVVPLSSQRSLTPTKAQRSPAGAPPPAVSQDVGRAVGENLSDVPVHRGPEVTQVARTLEAHAYTANAEVHIPDHHGPLDSGPGKSLLAHELTHVAQQRRMGPNLPSEDSSEGRTLEFQARSVETAAVQGTLARTAAAALDTGIARQASDGSIEFDTPAHLSQSAPESVQRALVAMPDLPAQPRATESAEPAMQMDEIYREVRRRLKDEILIDRERLGRLADNF